MTAAPYIEITTIEELERLVGRPSERVANKIRSSLTEVDRQWLASASMVFIATGDDTGDLDVSPKGDPPGFTHVIDEHRIAIPDRPGNHRVDGFHNILANPKVGLIYIVPGRGDTLRINGRARLVADAPFFEALVVGRHRPTLALVVDIDEVFFHCSKAFLRSKLWDPEQWSAGGLASRAEIAKTLERPDEPIEELERYYGPSYADGLYRS